MFLCACVCVCVCLYVCRFSVTDFAFVYNTSAGLITIDERGFKKPPYCRQNYKNIIFVTGSALKFIQCRIMSRVFFVVCMHL